MKKPRPIGLGRCLTPALNAVPCRAERVALGDSWTFQSYSIPIRSGSTPCRWLQHLHGTAVREVVREPWDYPLGCETGRIAGVTISACRPWNAQGNEAKEPVVAAVHG